jgi:3-hydroxyisobutyrate dehydrogenase-like beta-hydroxyacid dehydrogenase
MERSSELRMGVGNISRKGREESVMKTQRVGILHPGAMGSSVGAAAKSGGNEVYWASESRSKATEERAEKVGMMDAGKLSELTDRCDVIVSVCPPAFAAAVAEAVVKQRFSGLYLDANAISPERSREVASIVEKAGCDFVDGGIVGPPAWKEGTTRLYLSGASAQKVAGVFQGSPLRAIVLDGGAGKASALKMAYAAYTKGTTALLGAILALAEHEGVREALQEEWALSIPVLADTAVQKVRRTTAKAWRFEGEMREISETFRAAGLPHEFHRAAELIYSKQAAFKDRDEPPSLEEVMDALGA